MTWITRVVPFWPSLVWPCAAAPNCPLITGKASSQISAMELEVGLATQAGGQSRPCLFAPGKPSTHSAGPYPHRGQLTATQRPCWVPKKQRSPLSPSLSCEGHSPPEPRAHLQWAQCQEKPLNPSYQMKKLSYKMKIMNHTANFICFSFRILLSNLSLWDCHSTSLGLITSLVVWEWGAGGIAL